MTALTSSTLVSVLVVDDDMRFADYVRALLGRVRTAFVVDAVSTVDEALVELSGGRHHVCLLDYRLGIEDGLDVIVGAAQRHMRTPIVLLTAERDESLEFSALEQGAADYLNKAEMDPSRLEHVIGRAIARQRAENSLREREARVAVSEQRYISMVRHAPYGIFEAARDGRFLAVNPALLAILRLTSEEDALRLDPDALYGGAAERQRVCAELTGPSRSGVDARWLRADGTRVLVRICAHVDAGNDDLVTGIVEDVTTPRELEERLRQSQKMEAIGQLAGGVAHDFNNLLTAILGYTDLLKDRCEQLPDMAADLDEVRKAAKSAAALIEQLLAFSRKQVLKPQVVSPNDAIASMERMLSRVLGEDVTLITMLGSGVPSIEADPVQLQQVIINLAVNARDAMTLGGRLIIETRNYVAHGTEPPIVPGLAPGRYALITVLDTGCGMDSTVQARIFEPFFTTKAQGKGTGLGLATVYGIVKQTGGEIICESRPGAGTKFIILLPATEKAVQQKRDGIAGLARGAGTVLLVEDQAAVRRLTRRVLEAHGYTVVETGDPEMALRIAEDTEIDLLLTDVVMPEMNGAELARRFHQQAGEIPVLFMSGFGDHSALADIGNAPLIQKPFQPRELVAKVGRLIEHETVSG